jgi:hypothetical protein
MDTIKVKTEIVIESNKQVDLGVIAGKTKYILVFRQQNTGQNRDVSISNKSFGNVAHFRYFGTTVTELVNTIMNFRIP